LQNLYSQATTLNPQEDKKMNKKRFAIILIISLILSSFTLAFANNGDGSKDKIENSSNKKIHVHLETEQDGITKVEVIINGDTFELKSNGNSGNYTISKGGDLVSNKLTKIIVYSSDGKEEFEPAGEVQQGQEGQGSINYRINVTESDDETVENDSVEDKTDGTGNTVGTSEEGSFEGEDNNGGSGESIGDGNTNETDKDIEGGSEANIAEDDTLTNAEDTSTNSGDTTPVDNTPNSTGNNTITIATEEVTPLGLPEPQEIASTEETPAETEIEVKTIDLEDEEIPLDLPSTGVATPLLYGASALISLVGLLKRR